MKILYLASSGGPGGASIALLNLIKGVKKKHEVAVLFPDKGTFSDEVEGMGITCHYYSFFLTVYPGYRSIKQLIKFPFHFVKYYIQNKRAYYFFLKLTQKFAPDVIHTNVGPLDIGFKIAQQLQIKHVWHIREYQDLDFGLNFFPSTTLFRKMLSNPLNSSISITNDVFKYWNLDTNKDVVIYDGVLNEKESHKMIPVKKDYLLFVGRLEGAKGIISLLEVFGQFAQHNKQYDLYVAGSGGLDSCTRIAKKYQIENRVKFLGHRNDVFKLMEEAKALIVPSRCEGFGFITTEAMFNHCLVIGKDTAGTKEQFDNGRSYTQKEIGIRFTNAHELLVALNDAVLLSDEVYMETVNDAYNVVMKHYTIGRHVEQVEAFYKKVVDEESN